MTQQSGDPATREAIEAAVRLALRMRSERRSVPVTVLAEEAVGAILRTRAATTANASGMVAAVLQRVRRRSAQGGEMPTLPDPVELASEQSFPASDPPAWIWR